LAKKKTFDSTEEESNNNNRRLSHLIGTSQWRKGEKPNMLSPLDMPYEQLKKRVY
jgi:hypothetical protein